MRAQHEKTDTYILQEFAKGNWETVQRVTKAGGANIARASAKRNGISYRVYNVSKNAVYCEARPK